MNAWRLTAAAAWMALVAAITLLPGRAPDFYTVSMGCLICGTRGSADAILNMTLFLPLGFLLGGGARALMRALVAGILLSTGIEVAQMFIPGREATLSDVAWNGLGSALGVGLHALVRARLTSGARAPGWMGRAAAVAAGSGVLAVGVLLEPSPTNDRYWGQWTHELGQMPRYPGTLLDARLDGRPVPPGRFPPDRDPASALSGDWRLEVIVQTGPPTRGLSPILSIADDAQREIVLLGADGDDIVWRERLRAAAFRFDQPNLRLVGGLAPFEAGDTVRLGVRRVGADRCMSVAGAETCGYAFTAGRGWSILLQSAGMSQGRRKAMDVLWLMLIFLPVGFFSHGRRAMAANGLFAALWFAVAVGLTSLVVSPAAEIAGGVAGLLLGWQAARVTAPARSSPPGSGRRAES